jgi:hypothetical protein
MQFYMVSELWPTLLPRLLGFANSSMSFIDHLL